MFFIVSLPILFFVDINERFMLILSNILKYFKIPYVKGSSSFFHIIKIYLSIYVFRLIYTKYIYFFYNCSLSTWVERGMFIDTICLRETLLGITYRSLDSETVLIMFLNFDNKHLYFHLHAILTAVVVSRTWFTPGSI